MSDLIERGDAIKALYKYNFVTKEVIEREIMSIPSADTDLSGYSDKLWKNAYERGKEEEHRWWSEHCAKCTDADRPQGKWIYCEDDEGQDGYRCSECGFFVPWYYDYEDSNYILDYKACPHCLARMKGADDE